jgi:carbonic anhydrase/acetyltransferase-like protein (isoleucine patch superfamily)
MNGLLAYQGTMPRVHSSVFVAPGAWIIGDVEIEEESSIWFNTVVRGDVNYIRIGARTNVQDNSVLHVTSKTAPLLVGSDVIIGHNAVVHGCKVEENCLIGMGAIILDGAHLRKQCMVAAGSVVLEGFDVPEGVLVAGVPPTIKRPLKEEEKLSLCQTAQDYMCYARNYRS